MTERPRAADGPAAAAGVDLTPPKDLPAFARSAYESMPQLPPLTLTALQDGTTKRRIYVDGSGAVRIETFASPDATEPNGYEIYSGTSIARLVTIGLRAPLGSTGYGEIGEDPRVFVYAAMQAPWDGGAPVPGCEVATSPGEEYVAEPGRAWQYVGVETVAGRPTHHISCGGHDRWLDIETRLTLRDQTSAGISEVTEIAFGQPPADLFDNRQPEGVALISEEEYSCATDPVCMASPRPVPTLLPAPEGAEPLADLDVLIASALAADDALPAYEVVVAGSDTKNSGSTQRRVHHDGSGRYRVEWTQEPSYGPPSIWLVGDDYSYMTETTTDGASVFWRKQPSPGQEGRSGSYPLELPAECESGWQYLGVDLILDRPADHVGCPFDFGLTEYWIDRETHLVMRLVSPGDPGDPLSGTYVEEVVELQFVDQAPELFELPEGADVRP